MQVDTSGPLHAIVVAVVVVVSKDMFHVMSLAPLNPLMILRFIG